MKKWNDPRKVLSFLVASICPIVVIAGILPYRTKVAPTGVLLILVGVVLLFAAVGGRPPAIGAGIAGAAVFDYFIERPLDSFRPNQLGDLGPPALLIVLGFAGAGVFDRSRRRPSQMRPSGERAVAGHASFADVPWTSASQIVSGAAADLTRLLDLKSCRYVAGHVPCDLPELTDDAIRIPVEPVPAAHGLIAVAVHASGRGPGYFALAFPYATVGVTMTPEQRRATLVLVAGVGSALRRLEHQGNGERPRRWTSALDVTTRRDLLRRFVCGRCG